MTRILRQGRFWEFWRSPLRIDNAALVWVPGDLETDNQVWKNVGIRLKGNSSLEGAWSRGEKDFPFRVTMDKFEDSFPRPRTSGSTDSRSSASTTTARIPATSAKRSRARSSEARAYRRPDHLGHRRQRAFLGCRVSQPGRTLREHGVVHAIYGKRRCRAEDLHRSAAPSDQGRVGCPHLPLRCFVSRPDGCRIV